MEAMQVTGEELRAWAQAAAPAWAHEPIRSLADDIPPEAFRLAKESRPGTVHLARVIGQENHYAGRSWRQALLNHGSHKMGLALDELTDQGVDYFLDDAAKDDWYLSTWDGVNWYTDGGGNHRTVVAKFLVAYWASMGLEVPPVRGVRAARISVDLEAWRLYQRLEQWAAEKHPYLTLATRCDIQSTWSADCYREEYRGEVCVHDARMGGMAVRTFGLNEFKRFATRCLEPTWRERVAQFAFGVWARAADRSGACRPPSRGG